jgi:hypothetical protein
MWIWSSRWVGPTWGNGILATTPTATSQGITGMLQSFKDKKYIKISVFFVLVIVSFISVFLVLHRINEYSYKRIIERLGPFGTCVHYKAKVVDGGRETYPTACEKQQ